MKQVVVSILLSIGLCAAVTPAAASETLADPGDTGVERERVIFLDVQASTWRPKGRVSFGLSPTIKTKLTAAGFAVTEDPEQARDLTLSVQYREERGRPIAINLAGTEITCQIILDDPQQGRLFARTIHETPDYTDLVTAPYVEVVQKLQENPYFHFLGDLVRARVDVQTDVTGALIQALDWHLKRKEQEPTPTPHDTLVSPADTFPDLDEHYAEGAQEKAVEELGRLQDSRAVGVLERMAFHEDQRISLRAVHALASFDPSSAESAIMRIAKSHSDSAVRDAAQEALAKIVVR